MSNLAGNLTNSVAIWINIKLKYKVVISFLPVPHGDELSLCPCISHLCQNLFYLKISLFPGLFIYENMWENAWEKNCIVEVYNYVGVIILVVNCFTHMLFTTLSCSGHPSYTVLPQGGLDTVLSPGVLSLIILDRSYSLFVYLFYCVKFLSNFYLIFPVNFYKLVEK